MLHHGRIQACMYDCHVIRSFIVKYKLFFMICLAPDQAVLIIDTFISSLDTRVHSYITHDHFLPWHVILVASHIVYIYCKKLCIILYDIAMFGDRVHQFSEMRPTPCSTLEV